MDDTLEYIYEIYNNKEISSILEIGTAVGYSAICFTEILNENGFVDTIERDEDRINQAKENIKKADIGELTKIKGITEEMARKIKKELD